MTSKIAKKNNFYVRYVGYSRPFSSPEDEGLEVIRQVDAVDVTTVEVPDWAHGFEYVQATSLEDAKKAKAIGQMTCFLGNAEQVISCVEAKQSGNWLLETMAESLEHFGSDRMFFIDGVGSSIGMSAQDIVLDPETREIVVMPSKAPTDKNVQKLLELKQ